MHANIVIRPYAVRDKHALLDIWSAASADAHGFFTERQLAEQRRLVGDVYLEQAENWVATLDSVPAGFIGLLGNWVGGLFVGPHFRGRGIGRSLVDHAAALKGTLELEVYERNAGARAFYDRIGFVPCGRRETDDDGLPLPLIRMIRPAGMIES